MKMETQIEKSKKRIALLENQNIRFRKLLETALDVTSKSTSKIDIEPGDNEFWQETIKLIENEKIKVKEDLNSLAPTEDEISLNIKKLESDNLELQKKVDVLLDQLKIQEKQMEKMKIDHAEIKFLLSQPESNVQWFKNILQLDDNFSDNSNALLLEERQKLQRKIRNLERKKHELFSAIEDITNPDQGRKVEGTKIKTDLENALNKAIDEVTKREYEALHLQASELEKERSNLLNELQAVLDDSRKKIAEEYCNLQMKILEIEKEKADLTLSTEETVIVNQTVSDEALDHVIDAFSSNQKIILDQSIANNNLRVTVKKQNKAPTSTCVIL